MKIQHLRCFAAVSEKGSIRAAAEQLGLSATAVSLALRELERHIGAPLFTRQPQGVSLTYAGRRLVAHARLIMAQIDRAEEEVQQIRGLTGGAQNALFVASLCLCEPGDEVLVPEPMHLTYEAVIRASGATLAPVPVDPACGFRISAAALEVAITPRTRAIFFATPCNPTGVVMSRDELECMAACAIRHDLWGVSDEVHADLVYEREHVSVGSLTGMAARTLVLGSLSRSHAMAGWRVGWIIGPTAPIEHASRLAMCMLYGLPGFVQQAALSAFEHKQPVVEAMRARYLRRRDLVVSRLARIPGLRCLLPDAGKFVMVDVSRTGWSTTEFTWKLFESQHVSLLDAEAFGPTARRFVRLGLVADEARLDEACRRIERFVDDIASRHCGSHAG